MITRAVPVKLVHINKCPVLAQANTLRPEDADRLGINRQHCLDNLKVLRENPQIRDKVVAIFADAEPFTPSDNVDAQLYNGFFSDADRAAMKIVLETEPRNLPALDISFVDKRIEKLLFNYRARNFPGTLDEAEQQRWLDHRRQVFTPEFLQNYANELQLLSQQYADNKEKLMLLKSLWAVRRRDCINPTYKKTENLSPFFFQLNTVITRHLRRTAGTGLRKLLVTQAR